VPSKQTERTGGESEARGTPTRNLPSTGKKLARRPIDLEVPIRIASPSSLISLSSVADGPKTDQWTDHLVFTNL
jgi:hypothetical protein